MKRGETVKSEKPQQDLTEKRRVHWSLELEHVHYISTCCSETYVLGPTNNNNWGFSEESTHHSNRLLAVKSRLASLVHRAQGKSTKINLEKIREKHGLWWVERTAFVFLQDHCSLKKGTCGQWNADYTQREVVRSENPQNLERIISWRHDFCEIRGRLESAMDNCCILLYVLFVSNDMVDLSSGVESSCPNSVCNRRVVHANVNCSITSKCYKKPYVVTVQILLKRM